MNQKTGIVGENWKGYVEKAYVDANITGKKAKAAGLVYWSQNGGDNMGVGKDGAIKKSVAKGTINVSDPIKVGGFIGSNHMLGSVEDSVSMMKVNKGQGEIFYGSEDIDDDGGYWSGERLNRNLVVTGVSEGKSSYVFSKHQHRIKSVPQAEADAKIKSLGITADSYETNTPVVNKLNHIAYKEDTYKTTQDYKAERELAYRNIEKLQPFYNKEWIVNQGNKVVDGSNLMTKEVLSVTGMKNGSFVTDLSDIDKIMIHYADGTKEEKAEAERLAKEKADKEKADSINLIINEFDKKLMDIESAGLSPDQAMKLKQKVEAEKNKAIEAINNATSSEARMKAKEEGLKAIRGIVIAKSGEALVNDMSDYKGVESSNGVDENGNEIKPLVNEKPEYKGPLTSNGINEDGNEVKPLVNEKPEFNLSTLEKEPEKKPDLGTGLNDFGLKKEVKKDDLQFIPVKDEKPSTDIKPSEKPRSEKPVSQLPNTAGGNNLAINALGALTLASVLGLAATKSKKED